MSESTTATSIGSCKPDVSYEIEHQIAALESRAERINESLHCFGHRVGPILSPEPPCNKACSDEWAGTTTALGERLQSVNRQLERALDFIGGMSDRCEL